MSRTPVGASPPRSRESELLSERLRLGGRRVTLLRPREAESLIDEEAFALEEFMPYWAELWPSGVALAHHVARRDLAGLSVLELGCGLGLPSLVAALGGATVLATDWAPAALSLLEANAAANGAALEVELVRWDDPAALRGRSFDLVLAADVLYEERHAAPLFALLERVVAPRGAAVVADPGRRHAGSFLDRARRRWHLATVSDPLLPRGGLHVLARPEGRLARRPVDPG